MAKLVARNAQTGPIRRADGCEAFVALAILDFAGHRRPGHDGRIAAQAGAGVEV